MATRKLLVMSLILGVCSNSLWAQPQNNLCSLSESASVKKVRISELPGFFFKVHPNGKYIAYIESARNVLLDLTTGKTFTLPGAVDPVWSPDGKLLTAPFVTSPTGKEGFGFYDGEEVIKHIPHGEKIPHEENIQKIDGAYQSIGISKDGYRMVTDENGLSLGKISYEDKEVVITEEFQKPCSNIQDFPTDLPMLSKDGKYLSVYDSKSKSTKIFNITNENQCELAIDLGLGTGKVSFNNDSSQIAFHVDQFSEMEEGYFSGISKDKIKNVMVVNLEASADGKKLKAKSWAQASHHTTPGDGAYYPDFDKEGNIFYIEDVGNQFQFVQTRSDLLDFNMTSPEGSIDIVNCESCESKAAPQGIQIIAKMWSNICLEQMKINLNRAIGLTSAINGEACLAMVEEFWVTSLGINKEDLKKSCPKTRSGHPEVVGDWGEKKTIEAQEIVQSRCIMCHTKEMTYEAEEKITIHTGPETTVDEVRKVKKHLPALKVTGNDGVTTAKIINALRSATMPKGMPLEADDKNLVERFYLKEMLDIPRNAAQILYDPVTRIIRYEDKYIQMEKERYFTTNPNLSAELKKLVEYGFDCIYGQKNCNDYIELSLPSFKAEASRYPEDQRQSYIDNKVLELKCRNYFEVTKEQCVQAMLETKISTK